MATEMEKQIPTQFPFLSTFIESGYMEAANRWECRQGNFDNEVAVRGIKIIINTNLVIFYFYKDDIE